MTQLTKAEYAVLALLAIGHRQNDAARLLGISIHAIRSRIVHAKEKAGAKTTAELMFRLGQQARRER